jgi:GNAT superfamily N-acetyltransferase
MNEHTKAAPIALRAAAPSDVGTIFGFITELADYENLAHEVAATPADLREALFGNSPVAEAVIADCDGSAAGFALFFKSFSTFLGRPGLYLEDLYVTPKFRGRGVGTALLTHLAKLARSRRYGRIEWAVLDWNSPAIGFYDRMGARPLSEWITYRLTGEALALAGTARASRAMPADE